MSRSIAILFVVMFFASFIQAQSVVLNEDKEVSYIMEKFHKKNKENDKVTIWRVQLISTSDRRQMESTQAKFKRLYPGRSVSWEHRAPFYILKTGVYIRRFDALQEFHNMRRNFSKASLQQDKLSYEKLQELGLI